MPESTPFFSAAPSSSPSSPPSLAFPGLETITGWDDRGFPTTIIEVNGWSTMPKSYDEQGFLITTTSTAAAASSTSAAGFSSSLGGAGLDLGLTGKVVGTSTSKAGAAVETAKAWLALGLVAALL